MSIPFGAIGRKSPSDVPVMFIRMRGDHTADVLALHKNLVAPYLGVVAVGEWDWEFPLDRAGRRTGAAFRVGDRLYGR